MMARGEGPISFYLDGRPVSAEQGETILQVAQRAGTTLPHLCRQSPYRAAGACRSCLVEIDGERVLAPSCCRSPTPGMVVYSVSKRATRARRMVLELLRSEIRDSSVDDGDDSELSDWCRTLGIDKTRFDPGDSYEVDSSHPAIRVDMNRCIRCFRCVRACREVQVNDVIGIAGRGRSTRIVFDQEDNLGHSSCVGCGECVQACPTDALVEARASAHAPEGLQQTDSACPYCGVGCLLTFHVRDNRIIKVQGRAGPSNQGRLCVKGRFGFDYVHHAGRLTRPLVRRDGVAKSAQLVAPENMMRVFREASWDEALEIAAGGLLDIRGRLGVQALAGFGSAKGSNEEAYLFQKLVRTGFGTNNVDHCTRLCHASSVAALLEGIGSGAVSNQVADVDQAEVIVVIGARPTVNHPVAATFIKNAVKKGARLILMDPYRSDLARHAEYYLQFQPDTDVPMLNALMHTIVKEGLHDTDFIAHHTEGFAAFKENLDAFAPETVAAVCGIKADTLRAVARLYATAGSAMIFWGMGISQHTHGTDNARCLIALALLTGHIGRDGTGLHPLRGQNNVQGASDVGLIPMMYPGYRRVDDKAARAWFEELWQAELNGQSGLTVVEILDAAHQGTLQGMYIMGENPAMSDPDLGHTRTALARLKHLVVQEIFFTETAGFADVILPATAFAEKTGSFTNTDRRVQIGRQALQPPGDARQDLWIIQQMARRLGLDWRYGGPGEVFTELCRAMPAMAGMSWQRLQSEDSLTYPMVSEDETGMPTLFRDGFPTETGRGKFVPATFNHADELPNKDFPLVLTTGRQLEHWHTGSMTRRSTVLDSLEPDAVVHVHPGDLQEYGVSAGDEVRIESRRAAIVALVRVDDGVQPGTLFMAFCYREAAANLLTNQALDPIAKIPEFKYCAVRIKSLDKMNGC